MTGFPRYAIYFAAGADNGLSRFGAELLGYDAYAGDEVSFPQEALHVAPDWRDITSDPRKYGFHATLKAPINLCSGKTEDELARAMEEFSRKPRIIPQITPVVRSIGSFVAIVPRDPCPDLQKLAADCVTAFDDFRAPLTPEDRERRNVSALTDVQVMHLDRWGYPYVFEDFRFHMTLTGSLSPEPRAKILAALQKRFVALDFQSVSVDRLALLRQSDATSNFTVLSDWPLGTA